MHTPQCVQARCRCEIAIDFDAVILQPGAWLRPSARGLTDTRHLAPRRDREHHILERDEWLEDFCQSAGASDEPLGKFCAVHARACRQLSHRTTQTRRTPARNVLASLSKRVAIAL